MNGKTIRLKSNRETVTDKKAFVINKKINCAKNVPPLIRTKRDQMVLNMPRPYYKHLQLQRMPHIPYFLFLYDAEGNKTIYKDTKWYLTTKL